MEGGFLSDDLDKLFFSLNKKRELKAPFKACDDLISDYKKRCEMYLDFLEEYIVANDNLLASRLRRRLDRIISIYEGIENTLSHFLSGDIKSAYDKFDEVFSDRLVARYIHNISIPLDDICNEFKPLFRVRKSDVTINDRNEIFHIPFSKRHLVNAQRYSVAGLPCLYLGSSLYVCWLEMDKPDFDKL